MAWIALADQAEHHFAASGIGSDAGRVAKTGQGDEALLTRGSLVIESRLASDGAPLCLLDWQQSHPWARGLSVQSIPGGGVVLIQTQGEMITHATAAIADIGPGETLRITWSWDGPARWSRLALERVGTDQLAMVTLDRAHPLALSDLRALVCGAERRMDRHVAFLAVSTEIEPVGPMPTLTARVPVVTPRGLAEAAQLRRGDAVRSDTGEVQPVLQTVRRVVPARGSFRPVRLRAPYFGLRQDIIVAPDQRLVIGGSLVDYMFGRERVLVPARHLVNGVAAMHCSGGLTVTYHGLILPHNEPVMTLGVALETMFIGRMRRKPARLAASLLHEFDRNLLPEHAQSAYPVLRPFEALTLVAERAA